MRRTIFTCVPLLLLLTAADASAAVPFVDGGALPTARAQAAVAVDSTGAIHLMGGYTTSSVVLDSHDIFYPDGGWGSGAPLPDTSRGATAATGKDGVIYYLGGYGGAAGDTRAYALGTDGGWSVIAPAQVPDAAAGVGGPGWETSADVGADGKIYVFGGEGEELDDAGAPNGGTNSRTLIYDPVAKTWSRGANMPERREQHRVLRGSDGNFYVIGGQDANSTAFNTVFVYHPMSDSWTMGPPLVVAPDPDAGVDAGPDGGVEVPINSFGAAASPDRSIFAIVGGSTEYGNRGVPYFDTVYLFDVVAQKWSKYPTPLPAGRRELVAAFTTCSLHALGGATSTWVTEHDVAALISGTTEVCNGKDDDCNGQVDEGALCTGNGQGSRCVTDSATHCGCTTSTDCSGTQTCNTTTHLCEGPSDGGVSDGGGGSDGGSSDLDAGTSGGSDAAGSDGGDGGGSSSSCGCSMVGDDSSSSAALLAGVGALAALVARKRRRAQ